MIDATAIALKDLVLDAVPVHVDALVDALDHRLAILIDPHDANAAVVHIQSTEALRAETHGLVAHRSKVRVRFRRERESAREASCISSVTNVQHAVRHAVTVVAPGLLTVHSIARRMLLCVTTRCCCPGALTSVAHARVDCSNTSAIGHLKRTSKRRSSHVDAIARSQTRPLIYPAPHLPSRQSASGWVRQVL